MDVVLDTSVLVSAFRSRSGASYRLLEQAGTGRLRLLVTPALFLEYEAVLSRPEQVQVHGVSQEDLELFLGALSLLLVPVEIHFQWRPLLDDPDDEMVLEAAINGHAGYLVTHNARHFERAARSFGVRTMTPAEALKEMAE